MDAEKRHSPEVRERVVQMALEHQSEHGFAVLCCTGNSARADGLMRKAGRIAVLIVSCAVCSACTTMPAPRLPSPAPNPYQHQPWPAPISPNTVPADFPNPRYTKRVCKEVTTDQGKKRVCMWQPRH